MAGSMAEVLGEMLKSAGIAAPTAGKTPVKSTVKTCPIERETGRTRIAIPEGMDLSEVADWVRKQQLDEEQEVGFGERYSVDPYDGAVICMEAMGDIFGFVAQQPTMTMFGPKPPQMLTVKLGPSETIKVPWGSFQLPGVDGTVQTAATDGEDGQPCFVLTGKVKKKSMPLLQQLIDSIHQRIRDGRSIYRGKAVDMAKNFLELRTINPGDLIVPAAVERALVSNLFTPIIATKQCRDSQIPLKRGVLLTGPYGVGKSLTAQVTATLCGQNGWTFILVKDVKQFDAALQFAKRYMPAVVFMEDVDQVTSGDRTTALNEILESVDGVLAKGSEVVVVLTTNHIEKINRAMLRPGRLDAIIEFTKPDANAARRLLERYTRGQCADDVDFAAVGKACEGMIPAVIAEVGTRAKLAAIARDPGAKDLRLTTEDLLIAAEQLQAHQRLIEGPQTSDPVAEMRKAAATLNPVFGGVFGVLPHVFHCGKCSNRSLVPLGANMRCPECGWTTVGQAAAS